MAGTSHESAPGERRRVRLRAWGMTEFDLDRARQDATVEATSRDWEIVAIEPSTGRPNPLPRRDWSALAHGKQLYRAWALYPLDDPDATTEGEGNG